MTELFSIQNKLLGNVSNSWYRSAFDTIDWRQRLIGIKGLRGVGKTTMMLQFMKYHTSDVNKALYITADSPWFYQNSLYTTIEEWGKSGGEIIIIDEVHKYPQWSRELKVAFDVHADMKFLFSASSAFDIFKAEGDLSRRAYVVQLPGMSFREYLSYVHGLDFPPVALDDLLHRAAEVSKELLTRFKPLPYFKQYLEMGYFPFTAKGTDIMYRQKLGALVNTVLESDLASVQDYSPTNIRKIKKLLSVIAESAPFTPNISKIAERLGVGRVTVYNFLTHLEDARILNSAHKFGKGIAELQKPDKIYIENPNLALALTDDVSKGNLRESFFVNQIRNAGHELNLAEKGDFFVDKSYTFEVGGGSKSGKQIKDIPNSYLVQDDIEYASQRTIPLWMFGLLY